MFCKCSTGVFFNQLRFSFLIGWHPDFQKILGWLLIGFLKIEKMLGCGKIGFFIFYKNNRLGVLVTFLSKNARLDFNWFSVKKQKFSVEL